MASINQTLNKEQISNEDYRNIVKCSDLALKEFSFDMRVLQRKAFALCKLGLNESTDYNKTMNEYHIIVDELYFDITSAFNTLSSQKGKAAKKEKKEKKGIKVKKSKI